MVRCVDDAEIYGGLWCVCVLGDMWGGGGAGLFCVAAFYGLLGVCVILRTTLGSRDSLFFIFDLAFRCFFGTEAWSPLKKCHFHQFKFYLEFLLTIHISLIYIYIYNTIFFRIQVLHKN